MDLMWGRTIESLRKPKEFFTDIKSEQGIRNPFFFMVIVMSIMFVFLTYHYVELYNGLLQQIVDIYAQMGMQVNVPDIELNFGIYVAAYFILLISFIITSFMWYYITHLCVMIVGGKKGYDQTYKAMTYSLSADYLTLPAFVVSFISLTITVVDRSFWSVLIFLISTTLYFIPAFYRLYMRLVGLEKLQEISKLRAFIAAYILAYIFVTVALIIFYVLLAIIAVIVVRLIF